MPHAITIAALLLTAGLGLCADTMLEDFDELTAAQLAARCSIVGDNLQAELVKTDERAGKQNLLLRADIDPANPNWNHLRLSFARRVKQPETLSFWYRGDKVARLYLILEDSRGVRTDTTIGGDTPAGQWAQATVALRDMHVPNAQPPEDKATPADITAIEIFPHPVGYPGKGVYEFQIDDISVSAAVAEAGDRPIDALVAPVQNGGLERLSADGTGFADWTFSISREAKVSMTPDNEQRHSGAHSARFHNESPVSPHVYGRFVQRVAVQPGTAYRLSCWVKGEGVRSGNHLTDWQSYHLALPAGSFDWTLVQTELTTAGDQTLVELGLNVVNVTDKLWIDDITLATDLTVAQAEGGEGKIGLWCPAAVSTDRQDVPVRVMWQETPGAGGELRVRVLRGQATVAETAVDIAGSAGDIEVFLRPAPGTELEHSVEAQMVSAEGVRIASASRPLDVLSAAYATERLERCGDLLRELTGEIEAWERAGRPTDYPLVSKTVGENFMPWIAEDVSRGETVRALQQIEELSEVLRAAIAQCQAPPPAAALTVPRYQTGEIEIEGGHFVAPVRWPDGRVEKRPVFFNGYGHFGSVKRDIEKFPAYGLNIFQVEFGPSSTVGPDLELSMGACEDFERLLARAQEANVAVNLLLSPHYFPDWALQQWPELGGINGGFLRYDIDHPRSREVLEVFLRAVVARLKDKPGLHSYCLSNEPVYIDARKSLYNTEKWQAWLAEKHGDIATLNALYGTEYGAFPEVPAPDPSNLSPRPELYDWVSFNGQRFSDWHRWMASIVHEVDPAAKMHAKIMNLPFGRHTVTWGNDVELFCDLSQIAGNDCSNNYNHDANSLWGNGWQGENQYYDLLRSMRGQPVFNSENHVVADRNRRPVPGMHMRNLIWQGAIHGQGASTMWVWERTYDNKSDFAGSVMHRPAFCDAHGRAALDLMRLSPEVVRIQDAPARVALLYSVCSQAWNPEYSGCVGRAYQALTFMGEKIDFITHRQLAAGEAGRYRAIIAPGTTHLETEAYQALAQYAAGEGNRLILLGDDCLAYDEYDRPRDRSGLVAWRLTAHDPQELRAALLDNWDIDQPVRIVDPDSGEPAWGVGWRWANDAERTMVNVCNYLSQPARVRVQCEGKTSAVNLFTGAAVEGTVELQAMEPLMVEMR